MTDQPMPPDAASLAVPRRVLVTGAAGQIAGYLIEAVARSRQYQLSLTDLRPLPTTAPFPFTAANITDFAAIRPLADGVDTVVHLAAKPGPGHSWQSLQTHNIAGTYNVLQAASEAGCRRVVFASSGHVVLGGWAGAPLDSQSPVRPSSLYGVSKACGEALASYFAYQRGLSVICLRIGWVTPYDHLRLTPRSGVLDLILTPGDLVRLLIASIEAPDSLQFGIFPGLSDNKHKRLAIDETQAVLGYAPRDDAYALAWRNLRGIWRRGIARLARKFPSRRG